MHSRLTNDKPLVCFASPLSSLYFPLHGSQTDLVHLRDISILTTCITIFSAPKGTFDPGYLTILHSEGGEGVWGPYMMVGSSSATCRTGSLHPTMRNLECTKHQSPPRAILGKMQVGQIAHEKLSRRCRRPHDTIRKADRGNWYIKGIWDNLTFSKMNGRVLILEWKSPDSLWPC